MFKSGDKVKCIFAYSYDDVKINEIYTVKTTYISIMKSECLKLRETDDNFFASQFVLNVKELRKQKLYKLSTIVD